MAMYRYVKGRSAPAVLAQKINRSNRPFNPKILALFLVVIGIFFLANAVYPIVYYQLFVSPRFSGSFISPTSESAIAQGFGPEGSGSELSQPSEVLGTEIDLLDLTKASNWFPKTGADFKVEDIYAYNLTIPKLGVKDAQVVVAGEDLKKSLIQFPGTAVPGRYGNTVVFGHSVLPQFFNPKNYMTIFSTLPTLRPKDEIIVDYNTVQYKYQVEQMIEVFPNDVSILAQRYDDSYLTLITCVPPGTYLKRLIVRARLTKD